MKHKVAFPPKAVEFVEKLQPKKLFQVYFSDLERGLPRDIMKKVNIGLILVKVKLQKHNLT